MIQPRHGIITSIGREHLEFFGDVAGVAQEQGTLAELLPAQGKLLCRATANGHRAWLRAQLHRWCASDCCRKTTGSQPVCSQANKVWCFASRARERNSMASTGFICLADHQAVNALFAIAVGAELGLTREAIQRGLALCKPSKMRLELSEHNGVRILDDAYNANADSMLAALQTLQELPCKGRRVAVLGDMAELGAHSEAAHEEVGRRAAELGRRPIVRHREMAPVMARGARDAGLSRYLNLPTWIRRRPR